jgi:tetratricopeptide (TPR) repeat protein
MSETVGSARVLRLDEIEPIRVAGGRYLPLRRLLGVRAFGINAYTTSSVGDQLIEEHDETGAGSGRQEEAYIVVSGRALFTVGGEEIDAPAGTVVFVGDIAAMRSAVAVQAGTTAVVVGGPADRPLSPSPFEYWFVAEAPYQRGDYRAAIALAAEGLKQWPAHPVIHYQLACYHALAGDTKEALHHFQQALAADSRAREWAASDRDLDPLRDNLWVPETRIVACAS